MIWWTEYNRTGDEILGRSVGKILAARFPLCHRDIAGRFDETGKLPKGDKTTFKDMANGVPGLEVRLPLLFSEGVGKGRITLNEFVALTATNHARMYGLADRKGTVAVGVDADFALWDTEREVTLAASMMHDNVGYTPYEGKIVKGWPVTVVSRGRVVVENGALHAARGSGKFIPRGVPGPLSEAHRPAPGAGVLKSLLGLAH